MTHLKVMVSFESLLLKFYYFLIYIFITETNCVNGQTQNGKVYVLSDWNIKPSPYCRGVLVEGTLQG